MPNVGRPSWPNALQVEKMLRITAELAKTERGPTSTISLSLFSMSPKQAIRSDRSNFSTPHAAQPWAEGATHFLAQRKGGWPPTSPKLDAAFFHLYRPRRAATGAAQRGRQPKAWPGLKPASQPRATLWLISWTPSPSSSARTKRSGATTEPSASSSKPMTPSPSPSKPASPTKPALTRPRPIHASVIRRGRLTRHEWHHRPGDQSGGLPYRLAPAPVGVT